MQLERWSKILGPLSVAGLIFLGAPGVASAQDDTDVVVLLTEVVEEGVHQEQEVSFWWSGGESPQWTDTDERVFDGLRAVQVQPVEPEAINISRIYRRPGLSTDNAAQLGGLLDGERVLVGEVQYRPLPPIAPLGYTGVEVRADVELVPAGDTEGISLDRFTMTRQVFGPDSDDLLDRARHLTGKALGEVMGQTLRRVRGEVGTRTDGPLLALRNVGEARNLESIRERLVDIDEVDRVVERWASEGVIALEVVSNGGDSDAALDYALRVLEHHDFDEFYLSRSDRPVVEGVTEFWLEPREGRF